MLWTEQAFKASTALLHTFSILTGIELQTFSQISYGVSKLTLNYHYKSSMKEISHTLFYPENLLK